LNKLKVVNKGKQILQFNISHSYGA